jgi:OOP family OmpA-OmpF porin
MPSNLLETINSYLTPDVISKASGFVGENPANTAKAMSGIVPTLLSSVAHLSSQPGGATQLEGLLSSGGHDGSILGNLSNVFGGGSSTTSAIGQGEKILGSLLGNNTSSVTSSIAGFSGIGRGSASSLLALAAPFILGAIAKIKSTQGLSTSGLASLLASNKASFASAIPPALTGAVPTPGVEGVRSVTVAPIVERAKPFPWMPIALGAVALLALLAFLLRGRHEPKTGLAEVKLCGGQTISLNRDSFNWNLANFLAGGNDSELPKTFVFDNLNFDTNSTNLTPASQQTVNDLVAILKACPNAQAQLAGHTDNTGDAAANQGLSEQRAAAIRNQLVAAGIAPDRLTTAGYGESKPVASNDTEEGKARNRRTELTVTKR